MEEAKALLHANDLSGAIQAAISHVKTRPTDTTARTFLFELLIFAGEFDRAEKQLDALGQQDANAAIGTQIYRQCIAAERTRQKVFQAEVLPTFLGAAPPHVHLLLDSIRLLRDGQLSEAREKLDEAETERTVNSGKLNGEIHFQDLRDYNDLTASVLEVFLKGEYVWLPLGNIRKIEITKPKSLRDLCWTQASVEAFDGTQGEVFLPALYANSFQNAENAVRLGRTTDWVDAGEEIFIGAGTRLFWIDGADTPFFEIETVEFQGE
ncbi:MAG TPA: type VI secretion system accessory protein TagJ [Pyrinomonadaceae bacterium]|nr:type VI secretion system accessory protein TagJ [Pyrinomonadaceae bacterium]